MKIFKFLIFLTTTTTIFLPFLAMGQTTSFLNCHWSNAVDNRGDPPFDVNTPFQFTDATCSLPSISLENIEKIDATNSSSTFFLDKSWDYGELLIVFLMILFFFLLIFILVFNFFFEPVFKIRGRK